MCVSEITHRHTFTFTQALHTPRRVPHGGGLKGRHAHGELEAHGGCGERYGSHGVRVGWRKVMNLCVPVPGTLGCHYFRLFAHENDSRTPLIRVPVCARVSRVCPVCVPAPPGVFLLVRGSRGLREVLNFASVCRDLPECTPVRCPRCRNENFACEMRPGWAKRSSMAVVRGSRGPRAPASWRGLWNLHPCVRRSGVLGCRNIITVP